MQARLLFTMKIDQVAVALRHLDRRDGSAERLVQNATRLEPFRFD
jgi:hypothetical protein